MISLVVLSVAWPFPTPNKDLVYSVHGARASFEFVGAARLIFRSDLLLAKLYPFFDAIIDLTTSVGELYVGVWKRLI